MTGTTGLLTRGLTVAAVAAAGLVLPATAAGAAENPTLEDTYFGGNDSEDYDTVLFTGECNPDGNSTFQFTVTSESYGSFEGPGFNGTVTESGSFTIGPRTEIEINGTATPVHVVLDFDASFRVTSPEGTVIGEKHLTTTVSPPDLENRGFCTGPEDLELDMAAITENLAYTATITTPTGERFTDTGTSRALVAASALYPQEGLFQERFDSTGSVPAGPLDSDGDGVPDDSDNCPFAANPNQGDLDSDGIGDHCDFEENRPDTDSDGVFDADDNCPSAANPDQADADLDGTGDACDTPDETVNTPPSPASCQKNGWRNYTDANGNPFKSRKACERAAPVTVNQPPSAAACKNGGWRTYTDAEGRPFTSVSKCQRYASNPPLA